MEAPEEFSAQTLKDLREAAATGGEPAVTGLVLGSGQNALAKAWGDPLVARDYRDIPGLPTPTVPGHDGRLLLVRIPIPAHAPGGELSEPENGHLVWIAQGRCHLYEGFNARETCAMVRLLAALGVRNLVLTNAAGCLNRYFTLSSWMLISDHINLLGQSPLTGGPHFIDMSSVYDRPWRSRVLAGASELSPPQTLHLGVYAAMAGPQFETPAEIRMLAKLGADAVGMSTVPEAIQARALDMHVLGLSCLTNWAAGIHSGELSHQEVLDTGRAGEPVLRQLLELAVNLAPETLG